MGLPIIQVFMIMARQMSKPVAERIINYGKSHPVFRDKLLVPVGRSIIKVTRKLTHMRLGLKQSGEIAQIPEREALEQASDVIQQVVIFTYSLSVFAAYYVYSNSNPPPPPLTKDEFAAHHEQLLNHHASLTEQVKELESRLLWLGKNTRVRDENAWNKLNTSSVTAIVKKHESVIHGEEVK
uniref:Optic atrophy 3 protein homolog n=1 Tax=Rhabditophanes sp. KR3021 TaxID=114890 RepID=A0AC35TVR1_9BILA